METDKSTLESQILYYILTDPKKTDVIFNDSGVKLEYFSEEGNLMVVKEALEYFGKYGKALTKEEFELIFQTKLNRKEINQPKHLAATRAYRIAKEKEDEITEDQFERILDDFLLVTKTEIVKKVIIGNDSLLKGLKTYEYMDKLSTEFDKLRASSQDLETVGVLDVFEDIETQIEDVRKRRDSPGALGIPTGIKVIDEMFCGFEVGSLSLIVAMVGTGKSTFVLNISRNITDLFDKKVLVISLEMPKEQWSRKYNALDCWVPYSYLQRGNKALLPEQQFEDFVKKLEERKNKERKGEYRILEAPAGKFTFSELMKLKEKKLPTYKPDIIFIDQLSLVRLPGKFDKKSDDLGEITKEAIQYAQTNKLAIALVAQANRASVVRKGTKREIDINIENIEDSHKVGADAHNVIALMSPPGSAGHRMLARVVKQRDGECGTVELTARLDYCAMIDPIVTEEADVSNTDEDNNLFSDLSEDLGLDDDTGFKPNNKEQSIAEAMEFEFDSDDEDDTDMSDVMESELGV